MRKRLSASLGFETETEPNKEAKKGWKENPIPGALGEEGRRKLESEGLLMDFLKVAAEKNPAIKEKFKGLTEQRRISGLFW